MKSQHSFFFANTYECRMLYINQIMITELPKKLERSQNRKTHPTSQLTSLVTQYSSQYKCKREEFNLDEHTNKSVIRK